MKQCLITWTPRLIVAGIAGYYSLGLAYDLGLMAMIDKVAIAILKQSVGYLGIGALMPTIQWYSAMTVRAIAAISGGLLYDLAQKGVKLFLQRLHRQNPERLSLTSV